MRIGMGCKAQTAAIAARICNAAEAAQAAPARPRRDRKHVLKQGSLDKQSAVQDNLTPQPSCPKASLIHSRAVDWPTGYTGSFLLSRRNSYRASIPAASVA